ncbi:MAG: cytochrome c biogenesis protein CcsA [Zoogloeaceae bacterium]|jgi:ABC-type uncharacterized transport system permease subunit|nr:cytochrome c biogenesis protein CcsA [Zoogloeaceae bacterium]
MPIVNQLSSSGLLALSGALYLALGLHFWRSRWSEKFAAQVSARAARAEKILIGATLFLHANGLRSALFGAGDMQFSFALALCLVAWLVVLIYWLESFQARMDGVQPIVLNAAALAAFLPFLFPVTHAIAHIDALGFRLHFLAAMLAYGLFALAAAHALFMRLVEKRLHHPTRSRRLRSMPPLLAMEALLFRILAIAFALLTVALGSGLFYSEHVFGRALTFEHKTIFGIIAWVIFAILLLGRRIYGWRGRRALNWTLAGFVALLLAYIGSRFVLEVLLQRA